LTHQGDQSRVRRRGRNHKSIWNFHGGSNKNVYSAPQAVSKASTRICLDSQRLRVQYSLSVAEPSGEIRPGTKIQIQLSLTTFQRGYVPYGQRAEEDFRSHRATRRSLRVSLSLSLCCRFLKCDEKTASRLLFAMRDIYYCIAESRVEWGMGECAAGALFEL